MVPFIGTTYVLYASYDSCASVNGNCHINIFDAVRF